MIKYLACLLLTHCCDKVSLFISFLKTLKNLDLPVMEEKENLVQYKVGSLPTLFYVPDFITDSDQSLLLNNVVLNLILLLIVLSNVP